MRIPRSGSALMVNTCSFSQVSSDACAALCSRTVQSVISSKSTKYESTTAAFFGGTWVKSVHPRRPSLFPRSYLVWSRKANLPDVDFARLSSVYTAKVYIFASAAEKVRCQSSWFLRRNKTIQKRWSTFSSHWRNRASPP